MERFAKYFRGQEEISEVVFRKALDDPSNIHTLRVEYETIETLRERIKNLEKELSDERVKNGFNRNYPNPPNVPLTAPNPGGWPPNIVYCSGVDSSNVTSTPC